MEEDDLLWIPSFCFKNTWVEKTRTYVINKDSEGVFSASLVGDIEDELIEKSPSIEGAFDICQQHLKTQIENLRTK